MARKVGIIKGVPKALCPARISRVDYVSLYGVKPDYIKECQKRKLQRTLKKGITQAEFCSNVSSSYKTNMSRISVVLKKDLLRHIEQLQPINRISITIDNLQKEIDEMQKVKSELIVVVGLNHPDVKEIENRIQNRRNQVRELASKMELTNKQNEDAVIICLAIKNRILKSLEQIEKLETFYIQIINIAGPILFTKEDNSLKENKKKHQFNPEEVRKTLINLIILDSDIVSVMNKFGVIITSGDFNNDHS